jgi:hypothetical protein
MLRKLKDSMQGLGMGARYMGHTLLGYARHNARNC